MKTRITSLLASLLLSVSLSAAEQKAGTMSSSFDWGSLTNLQLTLGGIVLFGLNVLVVRLLTRKHERDQRE